jgi:phosphoglycolate phosphatase
MSKHIVFDLDGTIAYTLPDIQGAVNAMRHKYDLEAMSLEQVRAKVGLGGKNLIAQMLLDAPHVNLDEAFTFYRGYYQEHYCVQTTPYPDIVNLLTDLKNAGYILGVNSNKGDPLVKSICHKLFPGLFDLAIGFVDQAHAKPAVETFEPFIQKYHLDPSQLIFIGDSRVDYQTMVNAQITTGYLVSWGYEDRTILTQFDREICDTVAQLRFRLLGN